jgi:hypothetical protein
MNKAIVMIAALLGLAPAGPSPAPAVGAVAAFTEPSCLAAQIDAKARLRCYRATLQAHPHHWGVEGSGSFAPILDWHAERAWDIYVESASFVAAKEGTYTRTEISQYMYLTSLVIMTDVYAEFYGTDPRVKKICVAADAALKLAWQKTYCANGKDEPAASAVPGSSREDAAARYREACGKELPAQGAAPINCRGVGEERAAVSELAKVLLDKEREVVELSALAPTGQVTVPDEVSSWRTELVQLSTTLEQEVATGTFDPTRHSERVNEYRASVELAGVVAVEDAKADAVEDLYESLEMKPPADVSKMRALTAKPPNPRELCGLGAATCMKFEGALQGYYGKLEQQDRKTGDAWKVHKAAILEQQNKRLAPR